MFRNVLVPTDLTARSRQALSVALKVVEVEGGKVTLLHVIETIEDASFEEFEEFYKRLKRRAQKTMDEMVGIHREATVAIEREIAYGKRVQAIVQFASEREVDLIVLSSHRVDLEDPAGGGWGTISYKVGLLSSSPVLLVK